MIEYKYHLGQKVIFRKGNIYMSGKIINYLYNDKKGNLYVIKTFKNERYEIDSDSVVNSFE